MKLRRRGLNLIEIYFLIGLVGEERIAERFIPDEPKAAERYRHKIAMIWRRLILLRNLMGGKSMGSCGAHYSANSESLENCTRRVNHKGFHQDINTGFKWKPQNSAAQIEAVAKAMIHQGVLKRKATRRTEREE